MWTCGRRRPTARERRGILRFAHLGHVRISRGVRGVLPRGNMAHVGIFILLQPQVASTWARGHGQGQSVPLMAAAAAGLAAARGRDGRRGGGRSRAGTGADGSRPISRSGRSWGTVGRARVSVPACATPCVQQSVTKLRALGTVHRSRYRRPMTCPATFW